MNEVCFLIFIFFDRGWISSGCFNGFYFAENVVCARVIVYDYNYRIAGSWSVENPIVFLEPMNELS